MRVCALLSGYFCSLEGIEDARKINIVTKCHYRFLFMISLQMESYSKEIHLNTSNRQVQSHNVRGTISCFLSTVVFIYYQLFLNGIPQNWPDLGMHDVLVCAA